MLTTLPGSRAAPAAQVEVVPFLGLVKLWRRPRQPGNQAAINPGAHGEACHFRTLQPPAERR